MKVEILHEAGYDIAMLGLSLSYNRPVEEMSKASKKLYRKDGGHNKFLESIVVWLDITAARYWWQQFDTYRVGMTKQSGSTMHTIMQRELTHEDFEDIPLSSLEAINNYIRAGDFDVVKGVLPEGFLQRRICCTNYQTLRRIVKQRRSHRLQEWQIFINAVLGQVEHKEFFVDLQWGAEQ